MILDTSAIVAILMQEDEARTFADKIESVSSVSVSAGTVLEASLMLGRSRRAVLDELLDVTGATIVPVDAEHLVAARDGWDRFGRGSGSAARLNYGDCFSYAAARVAGEPLLFKGEDFSHTDVESAT